jgi:hypothetical protein
VVLFLAFKYELTKDDAQLILLLIILQPILRRNVSNAFIHTLRTVTTARTNPDTNVHSPVQRKRDAYHNVDHRDHPEG